MPGGGGDGKDGGGDGDGVCEEINRYRMGSVS